MDLKQFDDIYRYLFDSASEGLIISDSEGIIRMINPRLGQMFGYTEDELVGQKIELLVPDKFKHSHVKRRDGYINAPVKRPMGMGMNLSGQLKDGSQIPIEISLNHFRKDNTSYVIGLVTDISERKKMEDKLLELNQSLEKKVETRTKQLKKSEELHRTIAQNFPAGVINVFDKDLRYVLAEGKELKRLGITSEKLIGTSYLDRLPVEIREEVETLLNSVFDGKKEVLEFDIKNNSYIIEAVPLASDTDEIDNILVVEKNITEQKIAEQEIKNALAKEKNLNELKSRFVSMASHEFRTPLSTVLSSVSLIERYNTEDLQEKRLKHVNRIKTSVHHLTGILNDFLSLDKLDEGKVDINIQEFDFLEFVTTLSEEIQDVSKQGQKIKLSYTGKNTIFGDKNILKNVLFNLLSNAIKYSDINQEISLDITVKNIIKIVVQDNGIGIPEIDQKHMFERLFRAKNSTNIQGTGLGLNIVKKYIDLLNGEIEFLSEEGKGTTFTVSLPNTEKI